MTEQGSRQALRPSAGGMVSLSIMNEAARLKAKPGWSSEDRLAESLVKDDAFNILLMVHVIEGLYPVFLKTVVFGLARAFDA